MRLFLTGASGFLGSHVAAELLDQSNQVAVLLRPQSENLRLTDFRGRLTIIDGRLEDLNAFSWRVKEFGPDAFVHLGWRGVGNTWRNSPEQAKNIVDACNLATLARDLGVKVFVGAGSQAEYGPYRRPIREDDGTRPTTLYGMAKLAAGCMVGQICEEGAVRFVWLRIFSTYGAGDAEYWLIPSLIRALQRGERMALTKCEQSWGFLHARDAASAFNVVLTDPRAKGIYNLGSPDAPKLRETVERLRDLVGPGCELGFGEIPYRPDQVMVLSANVDKLRALGWLPRVSLPDGLRETVAWYDKNPAP